jgi:hypothetical protein
MAHSVECLSCGLPRIVSGDAGSCPRCGYVGWAPVESVSEEMRGRLRDVPVAERHPWRARGVAFLSERTHAAGGR